MKKLVSIILATLLVASLAGCGKDSSKNSEKSSDIMSALSDTQGLYSNVFKGDTISDINIDISEDDWKDLCENATDESYYSADITVNGTTVKNVGFRAKGNSTLHSVASSDSDRYGFKIKFDKYTKGQTLNGLDMMVLNSCFADPSYMREYLAYAAASSIGAVTPFMSYTKLSVNNEYFGLYLSIENPKDSFVERLTTDSDAVLYKADSESCTLMTSDKATGFDIDYGKDEGNTNILKLIDALDKTDSNSSKELSDILDVDSVLKAMAVNVVTGNYDSYSGSKAHNYYLLYADGKFQYIGWDYNMAFGGFSEDGGASVTTNAEEPFLNVDSTKRPLMSKLLEIDEYKQKYEGYINDLKEFFSDYETKINTIADTIRDDVKTDPTAFYTIEQFEKNITKSDTDLSQIKGKNPGSMKPGNTQRPEFPDTTGSDNGEKPQLPDGVTPPDINGEKPQLPDGVTPPDDNGQRPQLPDGMTPPDNNGQKPQLPDGTNSDSEEKPQLPDGMKPGGGQMQGNKGNGMLNADTVSIYDYISQKLDKLK